MRLLLSILVLFAVRASAQNLAVNVRTNGVLVSSNFFRVNAATLGQIATLRTNGTALNLTLSGTNYVEDTLQIGTLLDLFYPVTDDTLDSAAANVLYVKRHATRVVANLAELLATTSPPNYVAGIVLSDTGYDGASGDWFFDPSSTDTASAVIKIPDDRSSVTIGRWKKR